MNFLVLLVIDYPNPDLGFRMAKMRPIRASYVSGNPNCRPFMLFLDSRSYMDRFAFSDLWTERTSSAQPIPCCTWISTW